VPLTTPGRGWHDARPVPHSPIAGDADTAVRDAILAAWGDSGPVACFGNLTMAPPPGVKLTCVYRKPPDAGTHGAIGGVRRDAEAIYLMGPWPAGQTLGGRSSVFTTSARMVGGKLGMAARYGHPHAKPVDVCEDLIRLTPDGAVIADPTCGAGSVLIAARNLGRRAIGFDIDPVHVKRAAWRLSQGILDLGELEYADPDDAPHRAPYTGGGRPVRLVRPPDPSAPPDTLIEVEELP
jgi:site-specific DNA-methyltransferase (adenine-specific)